MAGVLIEAQLPFLLVGIGVNVRNKPDVPQQGPDRGRPAVCLEEYGGDSSDQVRTGAWDYPRVCMEEELKD